MDNQILGHLFEPFFTTKALGKGTGLGLATVHGIVKQNQGFINVYSEPGKSTTFNIYLPRHITTEAIIVETPKQVMVPTGIETVLLVEDETALLKLSKTLLEGLGYTVLATCSPIRAIQLVVEYENAIHLLMTDVVMPNLNGYDLWKRLTKIRPGRG